MVAVQVLEPLEYMLTVPPPPSMGKKIIKGSEVAIDVTIMGGRGGAIRNTNSMHSPRFT